MSATTFVEAMSVYHRVVDGSHPRTRQAKSRLRARLTNDCTRRTFVSSNQRIEPSNRDVVRPKGTVRNSNEHRFCEEFMASKI